MTVDNNYFLMPGMQAEVKNFKAQIADSSEFDHILIRGLPGSGKSYFLKIVEEHYQHLLQVEYHNCALVVPDMNTMFGSAIKENRFLIMDGIENLGQNDRLVMLGFMDRVRIIATMNMADETMRQDILNRFSIIVDVPPLYIRREDMFFYIAMKYPKLTIKSSNLLALYSYNWPGNFRELDRILKRYNATKNMGTDIQNHIESFIEQFQKIGGLLRASGMSEKLFEITNRKCFGGVFNGYLSGSPSYPFNRCDNNFTTSQLRISRRGTPEILVRLGHDDGTVKRVDCRAITTFYKIIFGDSSVYYDTPTHLVEPFNDQSRRFIDIARLMGPVALKGLNKYHLFKSPSLGTAMNNSRYKGDSPTFLDLFIEGCETACRFSTEKQRISTTTDSDAEKKDASEIGQPHKKVFIGMKEIVDAFAVRERKRTYKMIHSYYKVGRLNITYPDGNRAPHLKESDLIDFLEKWPKKQK